MTEQEEKFEEKLEGFNLELFTIPDESAFIPGEDFKEDIKENKIKKPEIKEEIEEEGEEEKEIEEEIEEEEEKQNGDHEPSDIDKTMSELLEKGILLLPDDYEYEDTKEGLEKAFEDSEKFRNQLAFQEAIKYLTSKEGSDLLKIQDSANKIESYQNIDIEKLDADSKIDIIKNFYKLKEYDTNDIDQIVEDLLDNDLKFDKEFNVALKYLKKEEEKVIETKTRELERKKADNEKILKDSQKILKEKLQNKNDYNGYIINAANSDKIFNATYKPVKLDDGTTTNEITKILSEVMNNPDEYLVLADLLLRKTDKGFDFSHIEQKAETNATKTIKKSIRDFKNTNIKNKTSGKSTQSQSDFDLSKASLGFKY